MVLAIIYLGRRWDVRYVRVIFPAGPTIVHSRTVAIAHVHNYLTRSRNRRALIGLNSHLLTRLITYSLQLLWFETWFTQWLMNLFLEGIKSYWRGDISWWQNWQIYQSPMIDGVCICWSIEKFICKSYGRIRSNCNHCECCIRMTFNST